MESQKWTFAYATDGERSLCRAVRAEDDPYAMLRLAAKAEGTAFNRNIEVTTYENLPENEAWGLHWHVRNAILTGQQITIQSIDRALDSLSPIHLLVPEE